jgi:serine/threonine-protein phosphatase 2B catalytic subunit
MHTIPPLVEWMHWGYKATRFGVISIASTTRECQIVPFIVCPIDERRRRRLDLANERLPELQQTSFPFVPVPSMRQPFMAQMQRAWGSGNATPTSEGGSTPMTSPGAGLSTDVPGAWPGPMGVDELIRRRREVDEGGGGVVERMADRLAYGRGAHDRPTPPKRHGTA